MARKVFISVLGTGFYGQCKYVTPEFTSTKTRFIQQATIEKLSNAGEWTSDDNIIILLTSKAKMTNWIVPNSARTGRNGVEEYTGLRDELASMNLATPVTTIDIPDGKNEEEIWEIFDLLYNSLEDGDKLYFDLTHGFRYLPMLVLVLGNYSKFLKNTVVKSITYGNYETRDSQTGDAPFVDITALSSLQDWTIAAADYLNHGDAKRLQKCSDIPLRAILKKTLGKDCNAKSLQLLCKKLSEFCDNITFNCGVPIIEGEVSKYIQEAIPQIDKSYIKPLSPLFGTISKSVENFQVNSPLNMIYAAKLCCSQANYQSAITLLQEGIISVLCDKYGIDKRDGNKREIINKVFIKKYYIIKQKRKFYNGTPCGGERRWRENCTIQV